MLSGHARLPRPRRRGAFAHVARALWTLPTNIVGHVAGLAVSGRLPRRVGGPAATGWLYPIRRARRLLRWVGAVTLGHAILYRPGILDGDSLEARLTLAHELCHTRQHDVLGPLYLPLHALAQVASALACLGRRPVVSRVHDANPLEQTFICLSASATHGPWIWDVDRDELLAALGA